MLFVTPFRLPTVLWKALVQSHRRSFARVEAEPSPLPRPGVAMRPSPPSAVVPGTQFCFLPSFVLPL